MRVEYRGYVIEIEARRENRLWTADAWVWLLLSGSRILADTNEVNGYKRQDEAETAALLWGKERVDLYVLREL